MHGFLRNVPGVQDGSLDDNMVGTRASNFLAGVCAALDVDQIAVVDYETYYEERGYTLSGAKGLTTTAFVRDDRFKAHQLGMWILPARALCPDPMVYTWHDAIKGAVDLVDWERTALLCHHTQFDGFILSHHYGHIAKAYIDTLAMSRLVRGHAVAHSLEAMSQDLGLGGKLEGALASVAGQRDLDKYQHQALAKYCEQDVRLTAAAAAIMWPAVPADELQLMDRTIKAYVRPKLRLDVALAHECVKDEQDRRQECVDKVAEFVSTCIPDTGRKTDKTVEGKLRSRPMFAKLLESAAGTPDVVPMKTSPTTGKPTYAFGKSDLGFMELAGHDVELVRELYDAKLVCSSSLAQSRPTRFLEHSHDGKYPLPVYLHSCKAHTLRWTGGDKCNFQNLTRGGKLRQCLLAPAGEKILSRDSSQIEARMSAWFCGQDDLTAAFADRDRDPYIERAAQIFSIPEAEVTDEQRFCGKVVVLAAIYGMGWKRYALTLRTGAMGKRLMISDEDAQDTIAAFRNSVPQVRRMWKTFENMLYYVAGAPKIEETVSGWGAVIAGIVAAPRKPWELSIDGITVLTFSKGYVTLPNGSRLQYPDLQRFEDPDTGDLKWRYRTAHGWAHIYGGLFFQNSMQALARLLIGQQALRVSDEDAPLVLLVHDEVVATVPAEDSERVMGLMADALGRPADWCPNLPVDSSGAISDYYMKA